MRLHRCATSDDYFALVNGPEFTVRWLLEHHLACRRGATVVVSGFCAPCGRVVDFAAPFDGAWRAPDGVLVPNWRDFLRCPACTMSGRQRRVTELITEWATVLPRRDGVRAYVMEQISPLYRWSTRTFPSIEWTGSEYLGVGNAAGGEEKGIRHEDAEALSFPDATFDLVVSCDVLEHLNDPRAAMTEITRVLRPGGGAILTFPMDPALEHNQRRAERVAGTIRHLLPEIYHGNPLSRRGSLVFTDFGWEVLAQLRAAGLPDAALYVYWAYELGYLGIQFYFVGHKAAAT
jgi:hypothetical protein